MNIFKLKGSYSKDVAAPMGKTTACSKALCAGIEGFSPRSLGTVKQSGHRAV